MNRGRFIVFEGLDGCGKTLQSGRLADALRAAGRDAVLTREPSDGPVGRRIRETARSGEPVSAEEELAWFVEDRRQHVAEVIEPSLEAGRVVVCDRYFLSTVAYQGSRGMDPERLLADMEADFPLPDLVLLLEVAPDAGLERVAGRAQELDTLFEDRERLSRVAAIFHSLDRPYLERIDGSAPPDTVHGAVVAAVRRRLSLL